MKEGAKGVQLAEKDWKAGQNECGRILRKFEKVTYLSDTDKFSK
jgi:hypothetical protein